MKITLFTLILLLALTGIKVQSQTKSVVLPFAAFANTRALEISKVTLSDTATVLSIESFYTPGYWIKIASDSYLRVDGKKYMIRSGEGIDLDSLFWMPQSGKASFKLLFEPLPEATKRFDFIEGDCEDCFKIYGVDLANKRLPLLEIPREYVGADQPESDFAVTWKKGEAAVSGKLVGHMPGTLNWMLIYQNPITGKENSVPVKVDSSGSFNVSVTVYSATNLFLSSKAAHIPIKAAPGKESKIIVNLPEIYRERSRLLKEREPYGKKYYYAGYLARLNNDLDDENISHAMQLDYTDSIADMDANGYKRFMMDKYNESIAHNNRLDIDPLAKKMANMMETFALQNNFDNIDWMLMTAYAKKHGLSMAEARKTYKPVGEEVRFSDSYRLIPYEDMDVLLLPHIYYNIRRLGYVRKKMNDPFEIVRYLSEHEKVSEEDRQLLKDYIGAKEKGEEPEGGASIGVLFNRYKALTDEYLEAQMGAGFLSQMWNTSDALLLDLIKIQKIAAGLEDFVPLSDEQKQQLAAYPETIRQLLLEENETLLARIEENKRKTGFTVLNVPESTDEALFAEMLKPFRGKVVLVDVWATWCGPCRMANKEMEPLKAQLADEKDMVFLYLAGEDSPENTWKNMISDLKGVHYRVSQAQWDYLRKSLKAEGVPTYIIIDREGNHAFHSVGFPGADAMKRELQKALKR